MKALIFLISLSLLVVTHELGHLFFAKLFRTRVNRFYVFFNWKFSILKAKKFNGKWHFLFFNSKTPESWDEKNLSPEDQNNTLWGLGWLPLGGYCDIAGMVDETKDASDMASTPQPWEYRTKPRWQRLFILSGGVLVNFVSALIIYGAIFSHWGKDELPLRNARLGYAYHEILKDQGFQDGDILYALDGVEQYDFSEAMKSLVLNKPKTATLLRGDSLVEITFREDILAQVAKKNPKRLMTPLFPFVVKEFAPGSLAKASGFEIGDSLVSINDIPTPSAQVFTKTLGTFADDSAKIGLYRNGELMAITVKLGGDGKLGIYAQNDMSKLFKVNHIDYTLWEAIPAGISYGWETLTTYVASLGVLFTKDGVNSLGGFISMANLFPDHWEWRAFWDITALLAVVLAFMNIIPIPGLDGGHIVITLWEMITRRPVNEKVLNVIQYIGLSLLILLMVVANGNDLIKVFTGVMR